MRTLRLCGEYDITVKDLEINILGFLNFVTLVSFVVILSSLCVAGSPRCVSGVKM